MEADKIEHKKSSRLYYMDILRILACIFVVGNHTLGAAFIGVPQGAEQTWLIVWFFLCKTGVPLFLMLSGALVMRSTVSYQKMFKKTAQLLIILTAASLYVWRYQIIGNEIINTGEFITALLRDPILLNYWYLYTAVGLYLMTPLLNRMVKAMEGADFAWYMLLWMLFAGLVPMLEVYSYPAVSSHLYVPMFSGYLGYYIMGYCLAWRKRSKYDIALAVIFISLAVGGMYYLALATMAEQGGTVPIRLLLDNARFLPVIFISMGLFFTVRALSDSGEIHPWLGLVLAKISDATFSVYILHSILIPYFADWRLEVFSSLPTVEAVATYTFTIFATSLLIGVVAKEIPILKKLL